MKSLHTRRFVPITLLALSIVLAWTAGASADNSVKDKQAQARAIIDEIQTIDEEVGFAAERWNGANIELESLTTELGQTRRDLKNARKLFRVAQARAAQRLRDLYVHGASNSTLEVLLGARSLDDVIAQLEAAERIADQDARIVRDARTLRREVAAREKELSAQREKQASVVEQLSAEKQAIEAKLAERQRLLSSVRGEIARLEAVERRRQEELRRQTQRELERQQRAAKRAATEDAVASAASVTPSAAGGQPSVVPAENPEYAPPPADASRGAQVVAIAMRYLGVPYRWGGASPETGFDCSGLTLYVYAQIGISLPHLAAAQYRLGYAVPKDQLQPGDLVFFRALGHMGMYVGGGNFIQAPRTGDVVKISSLSEPYYVANWVGARRIL